MPRPRPLVITLAVAFALWTAWSAANPLAQTGATSRDPRRFRSGVDAVVITATVTDAEGKLITGLSRDAFQIFEDGEEQSLSQFANERVPISLGVLLDVSDSMFGKRLEDAREAVDHFLFELLGRDDEYFLMAFNHRPRLLTSWTQDPEIVRRALDGLQASGGTAAWDAVVESLPLVASRSRDRAALVIISDGADTASDAMVRELRLQLRRTDTFVYAVAIDSPDRQTINTRVNAQALRELSGETGGRTEVVQNSADLAGATARIAEELNSQYMLGYASPKATDGQYHSVRVRVPGTSYRVRARGGYVGKN